MTPAALPVVPAPGPSLSKSTMEASLRRESSWEMPSPMTPPPMIAISAVCAMVLPPLPVTGLCGRARRVSRERRLAARVNADPGRPGARVGDRQPGTVLRDGPLGDDPREGHVERRVHVDGRPATGGDRVDEVEDGPRVRAPVACALRRVPEPVGQELVDVAVEGLP